LVCISSACLKTDNILDSVDKLKSITKNIELSGGSKKKDALFSKIIRKNEEDSLNFLVHSYFPPPEKDFVLNFADTSSKTRNFIIDSMKYIDALDIPYYSIHAGFKQDFSIENELLVNGINSFPLENIYENIKWYKANYSQKLALENLFPNSQKDSCFLSHIDDIVNFLELDKSTFLLLDLGHLKISAKYYNFNYLKAVNLLFEKYIDRIIEIHLSENDSFSDEHKIIQSDSIQYMIIEKFKNEIVKYNINLVIEARGYSLSELKICYELLNQIIGIEK